MDFIILKAIPENQTKDFHLPQNSHSWGMKQDEWSKTYQGEQRPEYAGKNDTLYLGVGGVNGTEHSVWEPIRKKLLNFKAKERYMWAFQKKYVNYKEGSILYLQWKINWC